MGEQLPNFEKKLILFCHVKTKNLQNIFFVYLEVCLQSLKSLIGHFQYVPVGVLLLFKMAWACCLFSCRVSLKNIKSHGFLGVVISLE